MNKMHLRATATVFEDFFRGMAEDGTANRVVVHVVDGAARRLLREMRVVAPPCANPWGMAEDMAMVICNLAGRLGRPLHVEAEAIDCSRVVVTVAVDVEAGEKPYHEKIEEIFWCSVERQLNGRVKVEKVEKKKAKRAS